MAYKTLIEYVDPDSGTVINKHQYIDRSLAHTELKRLFDAFVGQIEDFPSGIAFNVTLLPDIEPLQIDIDFF